MLLPSSRTCGISHAGMQGMGVTEVGFGKWTLFLALSFALLVCRPHVLFFLLLFFLLVCFTLQLSSSTPASGSRISHVRQSIFKSIPTRCLVYIILYLHASLPFLPFLVHVLRFVIISMFGVCWRPAYKQYT